jgi:putative DNA primase/helicase
MTHTPIVPSTVNSAPSKSPSVRDSDVPQTLRGTDRWTNYYIEPKLDGRTSKEPCNASGYKHDIASDDAARNFRTYEQVKASLSCNPKLAGVGFIFTDADDLTGVDLDHAIDDAGNVTPEAQAIIDALDSYAEVSISGTGVHIIARGDIPKSVKTGGVEMYGRGRFFTVTGNHIEGTPAEPQRRPRQLIALYERLRPAPKTTPTPPAPTLPMDLDDAEILERARNAKNGAKFIALWNGDISGYTSHSEADAALAAMLAFYTRNPDAIRRLFASSGLHRQKWDVNGYATRTVNGALDLVKESYSPQSSGRVYHGTLEDLAVVTQSADTEMVTITRVEHDRLRACETRMHALEREQSLIVRGVNNPLIKSEVRTILAVVNDVASRTSGPGEPVKVWTEGIGKGTGQDSGTVSRHISTVHNAGQLWTKTTKTERSENGEPRRVTYIALNRSRDSIYESLPTLDLNKAKTWGGKRERRCPDCPDSGDEIDLGMLWLRRHR